jgi:hypothetical protein
MTEKKTYKKPIINEIKIDNEISLIMMTGETDPPTGPWPNDGDGSKNDDSNKDNRESPFKR